YYTSSTHRNTPTVPFATLFRSGQKRERILLSQKQQNDSHPDQRKSHVQIETSELHERYRVGHDETGVLQSDEGEKQTNPDRHRRSEEHTSELQSREKLVCRLLL